MKLRDTPLPKSVKKAEDKLNQQLEITKRQLAEASAEAKKQEEANEHSQTLLREISQRMDALLTLLTDIQETKPEKPQPQKTHWFKYVIAGVGIFGGGLLIASGVGAPIGIPLFTGSSIIASTFIVGGGSFIGARATHQNPPDNPKETSWWQYALAGTFFFVGIALTVTGIGSPIGLPLVASAVLGGTSLFAGSALLGFTHAKQQIAKSYNGSVQATEAIKTAARKPIIIEVEGNAISHISLPTPPPSSASRHVQSRTRTSSEPALAGNLSRQSIFGGPSIPILIPAATQAEPFLSPSPHLP